MPNFSQSLAQYSQAVANRKTRREIKRQQEEAAAAARSAQNARSNRGFMGTLGGAAAAVGVGAMTGWNPATMAMAYQAGSALGSGVNSIVKPYNSQEIAGMPYTQPSGWETFNQVAPAVGSAYGAYQTAQQQQQQNDYNSQLNNLLKMHQIMDMNPAATMGMINQLNTDHSKKYELDGKQPYMFDMGAASGGSTEQFNYSKNKKQWDSALKTHIDNGDTGWILANHDSEMWDRNPYLTRDDAMAMANRNRKANEAAAQYKANAEIRAAEDQTMQKNEYNLKMAKERLEPFKEGIKNAHDQRSIEAVLKSFEDIEKDESIDPGDKSMLRSMIAKKHYDLVEKPIQEKFEGTLTKMLEQVNSQNQPLPKEEFMAVAREAKIHPEVAETMYATAFNKNAQERDETFITKASNVDLWNRDLLGREIKRDPEVVREQVRYMWKVTGASTQALYKAYEALNVLTPAEIQGGGSGADVSDMSTSTNVGNGQIVTISPDSLNADGEIKTGTNQKTNYPEFSPKYTQQGQQRQQSQPNDLPEIRNSQEWYEANNPPTLKQSSSSNQNAAWLEMQAGKQDGPPAAQRTEGGPAAVAQETVIKTGASGPPADEGDDDLTGIPQSFEVPTKQYAETLAAILQESKAKTTEEKRPLNPMERNRIANPPQLYHGNSLTPFRTDAMNAAWKDLEQRFGGP